MVSVIVPVYNAEKYLDRCISSVLSQTMRDFELILVNDGSKDSSLDICQRYASRDNRIKIIDKPNGGVSSARNAGIEVAAGSLFSFLDADDYYDESFLSAFVVEEGVDFYSQGCLVEYPGRESKRNSHSFDGVCDLSSFMETMLKTDLIFTPWAKLYSAEIIRKYNLRFNEAHSYAEDRLFNVEYLRYCHRFGLTSACGYHYTHENPVALTRHVHSGEKIYEYIRIYRPLLLELFGKCEISVTAQQIGRHSYNYHLIQAVIQVVNDNSADYLHKCQFIAALDRQIIRDASTQEGLPLYYRTVCRLLFLPPRMAVCAIRMLSWLKN